LIVHHHQLQLLRELSESAIGGLLRERREYRSRPSQILSMVPMDTWFMSTRFMPDQSLSFATSPFHRRWKSLADEMLP